MNVGSIASPFFAVRAWILQAKALSPIAPDGGDPVDAGTLAPVLATHDR